MEFHILGPLEVTHGGRSLAVGGARTRAVLALLLLNANRVVSADRLAHELWPELGQQRAAANLQVRPSELRKALRSVEESDRLATPAPGCLLRVVAPELDVLRFEQLAAAGREAPAVGDTADAVRLLDQSLALWLGAALADLDDLPCARTEAARLEETRLGVLEARVDAQLADGRHAGRSRSSRSSRRTTRCGSGSGTSACWRFTAPAARPMRFAHTASCAQL